jgi:hypothetical protein
VGKDHRPIHRQHYWLCKRALNFTPQFFSFFFSGFNHWALSPTHIIIVVPVDAARLFCSIILLFSLLFPYLSGDAGGGMFG